MHCPDHPKYKGNNEIKRLATCEGCHRVRQAFIAGIEERKNKGKGGQFSITSPGFRCGIAHLFAELGCVMLFGQQPPFFWRVGTQADPRAREHYRKTFSYLSKVFNGDKDLYKQVSGLLWKIWETDFHKIHRENEHELSIGEAQKAEVVEEEATKEEFLSNVHLNPLLYGHLLNGQEEKR